MSVLAAVRRRLLSDRRMGSNVLYLALLQLSNILVPLIMVPHLTRTIGLEKVGLVLYAHALMAYGNVLTEYGFNLSATRHIAAHRDDRPVVVRTVGAVLSAKVLLLAGAGALLAGSVAVVPTLRAEAPLFAYSFAIVVGQTFVPVWFFQGIEKMRALALLTVAFRLLFLGLIFGLVRAPTDYLRVNLFFGLCNAGVAVGGLLLMRWRHGVRLRPVGWAAVRDQLRAGWEVFVANFAVSFYVNANLLVLGFFATPRVLGIYGVVDKVLLAARQVSAVLFQATYPRVCLLATESQAAALAFARRYGWFLLGSFGAGCAALLLLADPIMRLVAGAVLPEGAALLRLLSFVPLVVALSSPSFQLLLAFERRRSYTPVLVVASALNLVVNLSLVPTFGYFGTAASVIVTEVFITLGLYVALRRQRLNFFRVPKAT